MRRESGSGRRATVRPGPVGWALIVLAAVLVPVLHVPAVLALGAGAVVDLAIVVGGLAIWRERRARGRG